MPVRNLQRILAPQSIAVIGATPKPASVGQAVMHNVALSRGTVRVYPINPKYQELEGACELLSGEVAFELGELTEANLWFKRSLTLCREAADKRGEANALRWLAKCAIESGDLISARARLVDASLAFKNFEMWEELLGCLEDFAELLHREGAAGLAIRISGAVARARERLNLARSPRAEIRFQRKIVEFRRAIATSIDDVDWKEGLELDVDDALRNAVALQTGRAVAA